MPTATTAALIKPRPATVQSLLPLAAALLLRQQRTAAESAPAQWQPLPHQLPPEGEWLYWVLLAGRGTGKTSAGAHYWDAYQCAHPGHRLAIIAPTTGDARSICVEGETGLMSVNRAIEFNRSWGELRWPNGARGQLFGAYTPEDVERLRGPQHHGVWAEELASWRQLAGVWDMMRLGLRLGDRPHVVITTTPKGRQMLVDLLADPRTVVTTAHTDDNPHLHADVRAELYRKYAGTRLGEQELAARLLTDTPGALFTREGLEAGRVRETPALTQIAVGVDPEAESGEQAAETGILVVGRGIDGHGYVLADVSLRGSPHQWAAAGVAAYQQWQANVLVAETNQGGEMVRATIAGVPGGDRLNYKGVRASHSKQARAEPVASLFEQQRIHLVGTFPELEDQLTSWVAGSGPSPDRLDALVWACTELVIDGGAAPFGWLTDDPAFRREVLGHE